MNENLKEPSYVLFVESKNSSAMFLDSEIRLIKKYCADNEGIVRFHFIGDSQVASMQFQPSLYDRVDLIRKKDQYILVLKSENIEVGTEKETFNSFKEMMRFLEEET